MKPISRHLILLLTTNAPFPNGKLSVVRIVTISSPFALMKKCHLLLSQQNDLTSYHFYCIFRYIYYLNINKSALCVTKMKCEAYIMCISAEIGIGEQFPALVYCIHFHTDDQILAKTMS